MVSLAAPPAEAAEPDFEALLRAHAARIRAAAAQLDDDFSPARYHLADEALAENAGLIARAQAAGRADIVRRLRQDRVQALRDRGDMTAAIAEYRALAQQAPPAPYVVRAAADALLAMRQPEAARLLYEQLLAADASDAAARTGLLFAHLEAEDFASMRRLIETWGAQGESTALRRARVMTLRFADRLEEAQALLDALVREAPGDAGLWLEQGDLMARRGLPRAAQRRYEAVVAAEPGNLRARVGLANALWAQGDISAAAALVDALRREAPEHPAVQRLVREWSSRSRPSLASSLTRGFGRGHVAGNDDQIWESAFYSGQTAQGLRAFANHHLASARFAGAQARHERMGGGAEWTLRDLQLVGELGQDLRNGRDTVWAAAAGWQQDDHWFWKLRHESQTNDFPLKGRQPDAQAGAPKYLHASRTVLGGAYRWNESRRVAADASWYGFNDGNRRQALALSWFERLYSVEGRTLDFTLAGYGSRNSLPDTVYFNPKKDMAVSATLSGDWLTWRRYERSFNQRVALTVGNYRQASDLRQAGGFVEQDYGWKPFQDARYEHEWQWGPDASARYGIGARRFAYDGVYETKSYLYLIANWRF